jgi:hypothetical protein
VSLNVWAIFIAVRYMTPIRKYWLSKPTPSLHGIWYMGGGVESTVYTVFREMVACTWWMGWFI